jgi:hypothetical protein
LKLVGRRIFEGGDTGCDLVDHRAAVSRGPV